MRLTLTRPAQDLSERFHPRWPGRRHEAGKGARALTGPRREPEEKTGGIPEGLLSATLASCGQRERTRRLHGCQANTSPDRLRAEARCPRGAAVLLASSWRRFSSSSRPPVLSSFSPSAPRPTASAPVRLGDGQLPESALVRREAPNCGRQPIRRRDRRCHLARRRGLPRMTCRRGLFRRPGVGQRRRPWPYHGELPGVQGGYGRDQRGDGRDVAGTWTGTSVNPTCADHAPV